MTHEPKGVPRQARSPLAVVKSGQGGTPEAQASSALMQRTCNRVTGNLRDMLGVDGCAALLVRCLARTEAAHPALAAVWRQDGREFYLDGVAAAFDAHGEAAVTAAIQALLNSVRVLLGRLIGEDMAIRIIDLGAEFDERRQGSS